MGEYLMEFSTKPEAEKWAAKRKQAFRTILKKGYIRGWKLTEKEKRFYRDSLKNVKVKTIKLKHWKKPIYRVVGV